MNYYFILTDTFVTQNQGYQDGVNVFNAVKDINNRWVCSINSVIEFPSLFKGNKFEVVELISEDFIQYDENGDGIVTEAEKTSFWAKLNPFNWF